MLDKQASRIMPRTTLNLDPSVLRALKRRARDEGTSIGNLISEMLGPTVGEGRSGGQGGGPRGPGRPVSATLDVNVLLYASDDSSGFHANALDLLDRLAHGTELVYLFWPVLTGYLRMSTHSAIFPRPLSVEAAMANVAPP